MGSPHAVAEPIREFNRFYTKVIGTLERSYLETPHSLQEARVIYEVATRPGCTAKQIQQRAGFDQGFLSRLINRLEDQGLLDRERDPRDGRVRQLRLTKAGEERFQTLNGRADKQARELVDHLTPEQQRELVDALASVRRLIDADADPPPVTLRQGELGDLGYLFHRQPVAYNEEFGFTQVFETYFSKGLPVFLENFDPEIDRLWVAEAAHRPVGWIAIHHVDDRPGWAKLRWFFVEREARGNGLGWRLLSRAVEFSRDAGYDAIFLWTVDNLGAASRLYRRAGFELAEQTDDCPWYEGAREQCWELDLIELIEEDS